MVSTRLTTRSTVPKNQLGRSFAIVPCSTAKEGFIDLDEDEFRDQGTYLAEFQNAVIKLRGDNWQ